QGFEEGTGFETFITWYKWDYKEYSEYKTTNIVRNLKAFYLICSEYLRAGEISEFLSYAIDSDALSRLKKQGLTNNDIMNLVFKPVDGVRVPDNFFDTGSFSNVVFPDIMETPFSYENRNDLRHPVFVRFNRPGEKSIIFLAELVMKKNPFQNKQFCFDLGESIE
ncbi:MAG: hypothetical protein PQJ46_15045, partial [Spirochaetales bacterium]|nr:hypothetical protein [Spirochaetales bacterium]